MCPTCLVFTLLVGIVILQVYSSTNGSGKDLLGPRELPDGGKGHIHDRH